VVQAVQHEWPADAVERRPIEALVPYARNARTHSPEQVAQIAASLREWGWTMPVLVDEQGTIVAKGRSDAKRRAYVIADNKLADNAGWDWNLLPAELLLDWMPAGRGVRATRIQRHLERLEAQRESPMFAEGVEDAIAELEARLRMLLADADEDIRAADAR
jgi:hypothetical protein